MACRTINHKVFHFIFFFKVFHFKKWNRGIPWWSTKFRLSVFTASAQVQSLVGKLKFSKLHGMAKKKKKKFKMKCNWVTGSSLGPSTHALIYHS